MSEPQRDLLGHPLPAPLPKFQDWLAELDAEAARRGYCGGALSRQTGRACWRDAYEAGMGPAEALDEDERNGD